MIMGLCAVLNSVSFRALQKCSFASVMLHTTHADFSIGLGSPISSFTGFFLLLQLWFHSAAVDLHYICTHFAEQCSRAEELFLPQRRQRKSQEANFLT